MGSFDVASPYPKLFRTEEIVMTTRSPHGIALVATTALLLACSNGNNGTSGSGGHVASTGGATAAGNGGTNAAAAGGKSGAGGTAIASGGTRAGAGGAGATAGSPGSATGGATAIATGGGAGSSGLGGRGGGGSGQAGAPTGGQPGVDAGPGAGGALAAGGAKADGGLVASGGAVGADGGLVSRDGGLPYGLPCGPALAAVTDYSAPGPFATTTDSNVGPDGNCVVFRPKTLGDNGFLHSPIVFGPGIGMQATQLKDLLLSFASHGYLVIGTGVLNGGPNDPANKAAMQNALDWIIQQNGKAGSPYQGKLNVKCAVSMGYSVGGTAAVEIGGHEAVATTVSIHGHVATSAMHGPLLQTSGDKDTVGRPMQQQTFDKSQVQTFFGVVSGADHGYIQQNSGGAERPAIIAWMRYWLNGDTGAKHYFWGDDCTACVSPWLDPQRKNWQ